MLSAKRRTKIFIKIQFSFEKMHLKMSSAKWQPFYWGLNVLTHCGLVMSYGILDSINIGSGNGLLPDGTKPLPEQVLTNHQQGLVVFT